MYSRNKMADVNRALERVCEKFRITELNALQKEAITHFVSKKTDLFVNSSFRFVIVLHTFR